MREKILILFFALFVSCCVSGAADLVENPDDCQRCGMNRTAFARSRTLILYSDGTTFGTCSIACAEAEIRGNKGKEVKQLLIADFHTRELIDAGKATWVIGGNEPGVMTAVAKWAFAVEGDAGKFITEHGGKPATFDQVLAAIENETAGSPSVGYAHHAHRDNGSQLLFNPALGEDIYHTHPAGMWMTNYKYMHTNQRGLGAGSSSVPVDQVIPMTGSSYGYMMAPTDMSMDMHMLMVMYGLTGRLTLMGMATYQQNRMNMLMDMGLGMGKEAMSMGTSGIGDTELRGIYDLGSGLVASLGLSIPTGDINQQFETMGMKFRAPYDMQLGSGSFDLKPVLTYSALTDDGLWNWGGRHPIPGTPMKTVTAIAWGTPSKYQAGCNGHWDRWQAGRA